MNKQSYQDFLKSLQSIANMAFRLKRQLRNSTAFSRNEYYLHKMNYTLNLRSDDLNREVYLIREVDNTTL